MQTKSPANSDTVVEGDIEELKRAELASTYLATIVANSDDAIISKRLDGTITSWNAGAERLFGYTAEEAIGEPITMLFPCDRQDEEPKIIERLRRGERVDHFETKRVRKDGSLIDISVTISPIVDSDGNIIGASKIARDISERKRTEAVRAQSEARHRWQKRAFEAAISGAALEDSLNVLIRASLEASSDARAAFYLVDADGTCLHPVTATDGMPSDYTSQVDGFPIGTDSLACGLAVALKRPVITPDVNDDPLWKPWLNLARNFDFRGCWSFPIDTKHGEPVGTFAMYYRQPRDAKPRDLEFAEAITQAAAIIISQYREAEKRRRAEDYANAQREQVRRGAELLNVIIDRSPSGFYIVDADFRISHINADSQARAFRNVNPAIGRRLDEAMRILWPEPLATEIVDIFRHTLDMGEPYKSPGLVSPRPDLDELESYEWQLDRITMPDGRYAVVCYYYDTTQLREAERRLREADRRKSEFLAMLSHELRNPLAPIRNAVEILRLTGGNETVKSVSETMERHVSHLVRMVDDLFDVNRISQGKIELRRSRTELSPIVHQAVEAVRPLCENRGHELLVTIPERPVFLDADASRLAQVLGNLLTNACKFTNNCGRIRLTAEQQAHQVVVRVSDDGIGIAAEQLSRIFDMFTQVDASLERSLSGLGIGLSLVKNLVEMHGGTVEAHSDGLGRGSEFILRLPISVGTPETHSPVPANGKPVTAIQRRILVVDDNRDSAKTMAMLLKLTGHQTHVAFDGLEAVTAAETFRPDVVLLDIGLPKLNGYDTAVTIRNQPWGKDILLIALTGWGQDDDRQKAKDAGFDAHMVKPVDHDVLKKLLGEVAATTSLN